ncbi:molybdopterin-binding protein [Limnobacter humi]|uniref:Molybdopterin-binding protein n=1 Tax=Limnobacter humi TaxID=1778671 RepID=A0ABT1WI44_9BURK|nr:molybdopterin-binding protein [Limnobacter humi]MCQ8896094.1 molybdopterin-binding protein [Limnobacter humi]
MTEPLNIPSNLSESSIPPIGLIVVGDEILSGLRQDKHVPAVIERLKARGLSLSWVAMVGDDRQYLADTLRRSFATDHIVLSCGGIGGTPDDHTRQAAAMALGRPIVRHLDAVELIRQRCEESGQPLDEFRLRMADFPADAMLIPNPYNRIAGFTVDRHHFVPGFPVMAWPMIEWVLDTLYPHLHHQSVEHKMALRLFNTPEARITPLMESLEARFPLTRLYSLPSVGDDKLARHIELGVKARGGEVEATQVAACFDALLEVLEGLGAPIERL